MTTDITTTTNINALYHEDPVDDDPEHWKIAAKNFMTSDDYEDYEDDFKDYED